MEVWTRQEIDVVETTEIELRGGGEGREFGLRVRR
jgi:hypothetical protein